MWIEKSFSELGYTYTGLSGKNKSAFGSGEPYIPYMNVFSNESVDPEAFEFVQINKGERQNAVAVGDALFTTSSETPEEVGMSSVLTEDVGTVYLNSFCFGLRFYRPNDFDPKFLSYALRSENIRKQMFIAAQGSTRHNLSKQNFNRMRLKFPTDTKEQFRIAAVLSAADEAITASRALVKKYDAVKQGLMQDLLGKGERMKLERCLRICYGKDQKQIEATDGIYPILGSGGEMGRTNTYLYNKPSVLIGRKGTIDNPLYIETPFWSIDTMYYTEIFNGYLPKYLYYVFTLIPWYKYNEASGVPSLSGSTIHKIEVNIPDLNEQIRIVEILTAADERLNIERERLKKLEHIKLGLMNDLLTSRVSTDVLQGGN
ncbi:MAG: hypothetical protein CVU43_15495 [Chloroflexi bacterium HGW-Chloroflexi-5]|nr:MAG: hypothetical protein CVU43_15495 [Chloroflexi bacterium HGW-Chloroflexi-5]